MARLKLVRSDSGNIYISASGKAKTKKIISKGGDVYVTSEQGLVRTGYIRTDKGNSGGKVYLQAAKKIKVAGSVNIGPVTNNDFSAPGADPLDKWNLVGNPYPSFLDAILRNTDNKQYQFPDLVPVL